MFTSYVCICMVCFLYVLLNNSLYFGLHIIKSISYKLNSFGTLANTQSNKYTLRGKQAPFLNQYNHV